MKPTLNRIVRAALRVGTLATTAALLAACGGGDQVEPFTASRVIAFGDESSVINADGSKYSVNAVVTGTTPPTLDCASNPIWVQSVAADYGLVFPQCPGSTPIGVDPPSRIRAANGARVADLSGQIDGQIADGGIRNGDLVTVLVGTNDVAAQFAQYPGVGEAQLLANVDAAGVALAGQANRLAGLGARVLISTIPDIGYAPFSGDRSAGTTNPNPAILSRLSARFNDAMLSALLNDGRKVGLIQLDQFLLTLDRVRSLGQGSYGNTTGAACTVALPGCTVNTLVANAQVTPWLWADDLHLGAQGQSNLGSLAVSRARNNPF